MRETSRRELLAGSSAAFVAFGAGCLNDGGFIGDEDDEDDPGSGGPSGEDGESDTETLSSIEVADGLESAAYVRYSHSHPSEEATAELFTSADDAESWLEDSQLDTDGPAATALRETDYESARAVAIEGRAPDGCHQLSVTDVSLDDGAISVRASLEPEDDAGDMCTQQLTAEGAVVRVTTTEEPPNELSINLTLPDGSAVGMGMGSNSASENESTTENDTDE